MTGGIEFDSPVKRQTQILALGAALLLVAGAIFLAANSGEWLRAARQARLHGKVIHETRSDFARIRVRERGPLRSLMFVEADGDELLQSRIDLQAPERLELRYSRAMFASFLFRDPQARVLIVGLGGGGMLRFLNSAAPETQVDAVEIDPAVVAIAANYFGTKSGPRTTIHTADAFVFLREQGGPKYDVIYMDAFLRPPAEAPEALKEKAQRLKTADFLREIRGRLVEPGGLVVFNLIEWEATTAGDLEAIREVFPAVYRFAVAGTGNLVVIASTEPQRLDAAELTARAARKEANREWAQTIELEAIVGGLLPEK